MPSFSISVSPKQRRVLNWFGSGLAAIGILFVGFRLQSYWADLDVSRITPLAWGYLVALSSIYGMANSLLAIAWWHLLQHLGACAGRIVSIRIYGMSQLARYIPGNVFHLAGRQALGMAANIPSDILIKASILELGLIVVAGSMFGWSILPLAGLSFKAWTSIFLLVGTGLLVAVILARLIGREAMWSFVWQMSFLLISASIFVALLDLVTEPHVLAVNDWATIGGAFIVAWLVGLVAPGAPAGVGVREMVLLFLLQGIVSEADLLMTILLSRIVTVAGDIWFFLITSTVLVNHNNRQNYIQNQSRKIFRK